MEIKLAPTEFVAKIKAKMNEQNLGIRELARKLGVSHPTVTELVTYGKKPSFDTCLALAEWLGQSPESTLAEAGLLPNKSDLSLSKRTLIHTVETDDILPESDIQMVLSIVEQRREYYKKHPHAKPAK